MDERVLTPMTPAASAPAGEPSRPSRTKHILSRLRLEERGTAVVEFALVALPLFLIVFGMLDFGRALNYYNDMTQLTGQGARAASVNQNPNGGPADANFQQQLVDAADSNELKSGISVCVTDMPASTGDRVTVTASYTFTFIPLVRTATLTLHASQSARFEASSPSFSAGCKP
jgi:Flp pilus assembly protein TadG